MLSIDELIASLRPTPRSYTFEGLPGRPTIALRDVDADHPAVVLMRLKKEQAGGGERPAPIETEADVERSRAAEALEWAPLLVERMTTDDGAEYGLDDAIKFCVAIAVRNYASRWMPFVTFAMVKQEASPDAIAGE